MKQEVKSSYYNAFMRSLTVVLICFILTTVKGQDIQCNKLDPALTYDAIEALVQSQNKRLPTAKELTDMIANNGGKAVLTGDNWVPIRNTVGTKDYIQVGDWHAHFPGKSQPWGWPSWADTTGCPSCQAYCTYQPQPRPQVDIQCNKLDPALTYDAIEALVQSQNKRLPTAKELTDMIANNGGKAVLTGDNWVPIRNTVGTKDYIQVGDWHAHFPGKSQPWGWPSWADTTGCPSCQAYCTYSSEPTAVEVLGDECTSNDQCQDGRLCASVIIRELGGHPIKDQDEHEHRCIRPHDCKQSKVTNFMEYYLFCMDLDPKYQGSEALTNFKDLIKESSNFMNMGKSDLQCHDFSKPSDHFEFMQVYKTVRVGEQCLVKGTEEVGTCMLQQTREVMGQDKLHDHAYQLATLQLVCKPGQFAERRRQLKEIQAGALKTNEQWNYSDMSTLYCHIDLGRKWPLLSLLGKSAPCPTENISSKVRFLTDRKTVKDILVEVYKYHHKEELILFYLACNILTAGFYLSLFIVISIYFIIYLVILFKKAYNASKQKTLFTKKAFKRKEMEKGEHMSDIQKRLQLNATNKEMNQNLESVEEWKKQKQDVSKLTMQEFSDLDQLALFVGDTVNMICIALVHAHELPLRKLSSDVFILRDIIAKKISDVELPYIQQQVQAMSIFNSDKFEHYEKGTCYGMIKQMKKFFEDEGNYYHGLDEPDMETIERYEQTSFYNDTISKKLLEAGQHSTAIFLRQVAQEMQCHFSQNLGRQYDKNKTIQMGMFCDYNKNAGDIWAKMNSYDDIQESSVNKNLKSLILLSVYASYVVFLPILAFLVYGVLQDDSYRERLGFQLTLSLILVVLIVILMMITRNYGQEKPHNMSKLSNLLSGVFDVNLDDMITAYTFFKHTQGVRIIAVEDQISIMRRVKVKFLFNESVMGTMLIRIQEQFERHQPAEFVEKLLDCNKIVQFLDIINSMQLTLGRRGLLHYASVRQYAPKISIQVLPQSVWKYFPKMPSTPKIEPAKAVVGLYAKYQNNRLRAQENKEAAAIEAMRNKIAGGIGALHNKEAGAIEGMHQNIAEGPRIDGKGDNTYAEDGELLQNYDNPKVQEMRQKLGEFDYDAETNHGKQKIELRKVIKLKNHAKYEGHWIVGTNICQGTGTHIRPDGSMYEGWWMDNKANGAGRLIHADGVVYNGQWLDDQAHGHGVFSYLNGDKYEGSWQKNKKHGKGLETRVNGSKYDGQYIDGKQHGECQQTFSDGSTYKGGYVNNLKEGQGVLILPNDNKYDGEWLAGKKHGIGVFTWAADGNSYKGGYINDLQEGQGVFLQPDGRKYDGGWLAGKKHGTGVFTDASGTSKQGMWKNGEQTEEKPHIPTGEILKKMTTSAFYLKPQHVQQHDNQHLVSILGKDGNQGNVQLSSFKITRNYAKWTIQDFDGTVWFRISSVQSPAHFLQVDLYDVNLSTDRNDTTLWKVTEIQENIIHLTPKCLQNSILNCVDGKGEGSSVKVDIGVNSDAATSKWEVQLVSDQPEKESLIGSCFIF